MPQIDISGSDSKLSCDKIQGQSASTITVPTGHTVAITDASGLTVGGTNYEVGTTANKLVQLNGSAELPAVSGANLTGVGVAGISSSANATAITIDSDEKVGIGGAPDEKLHITNGYLKFSGGAYGVRHADSFVVQTGGTTEHLRVSSTGTVTIPQQPCFLACLSANASNVTGSGTQYSTAGKTFTEIYDIGSNFSSGTFTAPVTGKYILYGSFYFANTNTNNNQTIVYMTTSNRSYNSHRSHGHNIYPYQGNFTASVVADMDASDTFHMTVNMYGHSSDTVHVYGTGTPQNGTFMGASLIA